MKLKSKSMLKVLAFMLVIGLGVGPIFAQDDPFNPISGGTFHPISILKATINGVDLEPEDWVGVIDENGRTEAGEDGTVEVAAGQWESNLSLSAVMSVRPPVPGAEPSAGAKEGNDLVFLIYDASSDQFLSATPIIPDGFGPKVFTIGILTIVQELQATADIGNNPPTAADDTAETDEDTAVTTGDVLANDSDPDGDTLSVDSVDTTGTKGSVTDNGDGTFTYDPNGQFEDLDDGDQETDSFSYTVSDGNGGTATATVTVTINGVTDQVENQPPTAEDDAAETDEDTSATTGDVLANDSDPDGDTLSVDSVDTTGTKGSVTDNGDGTFTYDPNGQFEDLNDGDQETDSFSYTVSDGNGGTATATVTVTINGVTDQVENQPPTAEDDAAETDEDTSVTTGDVLANDSDPDGDTLSVDSVDTTGTKGSVTDNGDGTFTYDPNGQFEDLNDGDQETDSFSYTVSDGNGGTATATVTVTINGVTDQVENNPPTAEDDAAETDEDTSVTTGDVLANDSDPDGDTLSVDSVDTTGTKGTVTDDGDGTFTYDPNGQFEDLNDGDQETDSFSYTVSDGNGGTATATVTVTINGVTDVVGEDPFDPISGGTFQPISVLNATINGEELDSEDWVGVIDENGRTEAGEDGEVVVAAAPWESNLSLSAVISVRPPVPGAEPSAGAKEGNPLVFLIYDASSDQFLPATAVIPDGFGPDVFTIGVLTIVQELQATVDVENNPPTAEDDAAETDEDTSVSVDVLANDSDPDGDTLSVDSVDTTGTKGSVTDNGDGTVTYDPNGQFEDLNDGDQETDSFSYTVSDGNGGTDTATVTITINGVTDGDNSPPTAEDDAAETDEDTSATVDVLANDSDPDGDTLSVDSVDTTGTKGSVTDNGDGTVTYDPNGQFEHLNDGDQETDSFSYTVSDGNGGTDTATVTVTINGVTDQVDNNPPTAEDDAAETDEDTSATIDVLANDSDPDGDTLSVDSVDTTGTKGSVTDNGDGTVTYDPNGQFEDLNDGDQETDSFSYTVSDGNGGTDTATVTISINGITDGDNNPPAVAGVIVVSDPDPATENSTLTAFPIGISDPDGDDVDILFQWRNGGNDIAGATESTLDNNDDTLFDEGDEITVVITPSDGKDEGESVESSPITIGSGDPSDIWAVTPDMLNFGDVGVALPEGSGPCQLSVQLKNTGSEDQTVDRISSDNPDFDYELVGDLGQTVEPDEVVTIFVTATPTAVGPSMGNLTIETSSGSVVVPVKVNGSESANQLILGSVATDEIEAGELIEVPISLNSDRDLLLLDMTVGIHPAFEFFDVFVDSNRAPGDVIIQLPEEDSVRVTISDFLDPAVEQGTGPIAFLILYAIHDIDYGVFPLVFDPDTIDAIDTSLNAVDIVAKNGEIVVIPIPECIVGLFKLDVDQDGVVGFRDIVFTFRRVFGHPTLPDGVILPDGVTEEIINTNIDLLTTVACDGIAPLDVDLNGQVDFRDIVFTFRRLFGHSTLPDGAILPDGVTVDDVNERIDLIIDLDLFKPL